MEIMERTAELFRGVRNHYRDFMDAPVARLQRDLTADLIEASIRQARIVFVEQLHLYDQGYAVFQLNPPYNVDNLPAQARRLLSPDGFVNNNPPIDLELNAYGLDSNRTAIMKMRTIKGNLEIRTIASAYGYITPPYPRSLYIFSEPDLTSGLARRSGLEYSQFAYGCVFFVKGELDRLSLPQSTPQV